jgi:hypothetical protein
LTSRWEEVKMMGMKGDDCWVPFVSG